MMNGMLPGKKMMMMMTVMKKGRPLLGKLDKALRRLYLVESCHPGLNQLLRIHLILPLSPLQPHPRPHPHLPHPQHRKRQ